MKINIFFIILFLFIQISFFAQNEIDDEILNLQNNLQELDSTEIKLISEIEQLKLQKYQLELLEKGIPELKFEDKLVCHLAYCLVYNSKYHLAKWTAHIISPDIKHGTNSRSNDFRIDSLVKTGTASDEDYFLKTYKDGKTKYDGFGYDRGHLAPSADFKWSAEALSESYFYSNMTPQLPDFNRKYWAEVESFCRDFVVNNEQKVFIVTAPVITDTMSVQERSIHKIGIPFYHYKIMVDYDKKNGIAFLMPQINIGYPIESYVVTIDSIEKLTGINFFPKLSVEDEKKIESTADISLWRSGKNKNDVAPILNNQLPKNYYNTIEAKQFCDYPKEVTICGKVVSITKSKKGHIFINLDKSFPKQIFSITIWNANLPNFSYEPEIFLQDKKICVKGKIVDYQGTPCVYPENEKFIEVE